MNIARQRDATCLEEFGVTFAELAALVAVVAHHRAYRGHPVRRSEVAEFIAWHEGIGVDNACRALTRLFRRGLLDAELFGNGSTALAYSPTTRGHGKVAGWAGHEMRKTG